MSKGTKNLHPYPIPYPRLAGSSDHASLVVMSKGTKFTQQSYKVADTFPFEWIKKKWKEGFHITGLATGGGEKTPQWAVVMSRAAGFSDQCIELDFQYPSEGIHRRWDSGTPPPPPHPFPPLFLISANVV